MMWIAVRTYAVDEWSTEEMRYRIRVTASDGKVVEDITDDTMLGAQQELRRRGYKRKEDL